MATSSEPPQPSLPPHAEGAAQAVADVANAHRSAATGPHRVAQRLIAALGRPAAVVAILLASLGWVALNFGLVRAGRAAPDPEFAGMELIATLAALLLAALILVTQRRDDELAEQRAQLTLQLSLVAEQKTAKIIELLQALRADLPSIAADDNPETSAMAAPVGTEEVLSAIEEKRA